MPINVNCPGCGGTIKAPDNLAGRKVKCPKCAAVMMLPAGDTVVEAIQEAAPAPAAAPPPPPRSAPAKRERDDDWADDDYDAAPRGRSIARREGGGGTNGMAIAGMVLGIIGFILAFIPCFGWVMAIVLGIVGTVLSGIGIAGASKQGNAKGMAVTGLVLSILAVIWGPAWFFIYFYAAVNTANQAVQQAINQANANQQAFQNFQPNNPQGAPTPATGKMTLNNGQTTMQGNLAANDPRDRMRPASVCKVYTIDMVAGKTYQIDMLQAAGGPDPYLRLEDSAGKNLAQDDDGGDHLNARLMFTCPQTGQYRIVVTTFGGGTGNFTLTVAER